MMNGKKLSKSLERLSTLSVQPSAGDANSTSSLRLSSNHQEFVSPPRPRIPPRPNEQALARFKQQQVNLSAAGSPGAARPPGRAARTKYVEVHVSSPKEGTRRGGGEGRTSGVTAPRHSSPVTKSAAARTSYVVLKLNEGSPPSRSQRTSSKQPKKGVQRCRSSVGEQPRRHDNVPRRSAVLSATTTSVNPLVNENLQAPKSETLSPPLRKPRKLSQPTRPTTSLPPQAVCETTLETHQVCHIASPHIIDSRTGTAYTENGENTPRGVDITRQTQAPPSGDFNQEPQTVYPSSGNISHLPRNESTDNSKHSNLQPRRPPPPSRKPPIRPPIPRPRKTRISAINSLDPPELDPYVQMSPVSSSISCPKSSTDQLISSPAPPFPSSYGNINRTPLPQASGPWHGGMRETEINVEDDGAYENDSPFYSYVDLVKNQHLMIRTNFTGPHASNTHKDDDAGPPSVYMPLDLSTTDNPETDDGNGEYMNPEPVDPLSCSMTPQQPDDENVLTNGGNKEKEHLREPLYMMPGDQVYYDDAGAAIPLATSDTYAPLTTVTKLEEAVYTVRMNSPTPLPILPS